MGCDIKLYIESSKGCIMLLKNVIQDIRHHNWFAVLLDFAVVVIGILVAMQLTDWQKSKNDNN